MAEQQRMQMPGVFGGLMRYDDEYHSKFMISPKVVVALIIFLILFVLGLRIFFPVRSLALFSGSFFGKYGILWGLLNFISF